LERLERMKEVVLTLADELINSKSTKVGVLTQAGIFSRLERLERMKVVILILADELINSKRTKVDVLNPAGIFSKSKRLEHMKKWYHDIINN